ncbi:MAG: MFS transporter [Armatimonadota bacterium]
MDRYLLQKRNIFFLTLEGTIFFLGIAFINQNTVVALFIHEYSGGVMLAGLAATIKIASGVAPRLIIDPYLCSIRDMPRITSRFMMIFRPLFLLMVPLLLFFSHSSITVWIFILFYTVFWCMHAVISMFWMDVFSRTVSIEKRGQVIGNQQLFGGIGALFAGFLIKSILDNSRFSTDLKYSIIFSIGSLILFSSALPMTAVKDLPRYYIDNTQLSISDFLLNLPKYFKANPQFSKMIIVECISKISDLFVPFIIVYMKDTYKLNIHQVTTLIYIQLAGSFLGGALWGNVSKNFGNKYVIMFSQINVIIYCSLTIIFSLNKFLPGVFYVICFINLLSAVNSSAWLGFLNYTLDVSRENDRANLLVLRSLILFPVSFLNILSGFLGEHYGLVIVIIVSVTFALTGTILSSGLKSLKQLKAHCSVDTKESNRLIPT